MHNPDAPGRGASRPGPGQTLLTCHAPAAHCWASGCPGKVVLDNVLERFPVVGSSTGLSQRVLFNHCPQGPGLDRPPTSVPIHSLRTEQPEGCQVWSGRGKPTPRRGSGFLTTYHLAKTGKTSYPARRREPPQE